MIRLIVTAQDESRIVETADPVVTIGRGAEHSVRIFDDAASRDHCRIQPTPEGTWKLIDLASRNGTRLNGQLIDEHPLKTRDIITIGKTTIAVDALSDQAVPPALKLAGESIEDREPPQSIELVFLTGPLAGQSHLVTQKITSIGRRKRDNDIALFDTGISNRHAEIRRGPEGFILVDEGSRNGIFLNGERIRRSPIKPGDRVQLGKSLVEVRLAGPAPAASDQPSHGEPDQPEAGPAAAGALGEPGGLPQAATIPWRALALAGAIVLLIVAVTAVYVARTLRARRARQVATAPGTDTQPAASPSGGAATTKVSTSDTATAGAAAASRCKAEMAAAERLVAEKRYAEALQRFGDIASRYNAEAARARAAAIGQEIQARLEGALQVLRRAQLTEEAADFDAARHALEALQAPLKGTPQEKELANALQRVATEREAATSRRTNAMASALLRAATDHLQSKEPHIAALCCRELLARFPDTPAAAEAKALINTLQSPPPVSKAK